MKLIRCLIFDLGGVITLPQKMEKVDEMIEAIGLRLPRASFQSAYFAQRAAYDRGDISVEEYWRRVGRDLGAEPDGAAVDRLKKADIQSWFNINEGVVELLREARRKVGKLVLLSNLPVEGAKHLRSSYDWLGLFDELVLSCELRRIKPESEIYELCLERSGARAGDSLFVDDSPANTDAARALGMSAISFEGLEELKTGLAGGYELAK
ncbi:MAG TPA: HAD family phosphatase [Rectinemataceae bacterium]|nr:HAD family phosphatase [Rectinemataceae bacterium]